jgi:ribokinase
MVMQPGGPQIVVFGSLNMDIVVRVPRVPEAGETLQAHALITNPGGKGANQAVACARMGARVAMIGCVGNDDFGAQLRDVLHADSIDTGHVRIAGPTSGVAVIFVDDEAENRIAIVAGANAAVCPADADAAAALLQAAALTVLQLEVPMEAVVQAAAIAHRAGRRVLLNPAPVGELPAALWPLIDVLVLNETEAGCLAGIAVDGVASAMPACEALLARGPSTVILTLGADGAVLADSDGCRHFPALKVDALDTTAAGDTFIGAFSAARVGGESVEQAVDLALHAAAICVTRFGAQASIPHRAELRVPVDSGGAAT